jgi:hypothetical protein
MREAVLSEKDRLTAADLIPRAALFLLPTGIDGTRLFVQ